MTDTINELASKKIKSGIEKLLEDNEQFYISGEYNFNPDVVEFNCNTSYHTNRINIEDYRLYKDILKQIKIFRKIQGTNARSERSMKNYLDEMIFWK
ncbi:MAG: hypothetical protein II309_01995 [Bacilli bacterium]|nr:hypothetical protein [Bacilli bacterium]